MKKKDIFIKEIKGDLWLNHPVTGKYQPSETLLFDAIKKKRRK